MIDLVRKLGVFALGFFVGCAFTGFQVGLGLI